MKFSLIFADYNADRAYSASLVHHNLRISACHLRSSARNIIVLFLILSAYFVQIPLLFAQDTLPLHYSRTITAKELSDHVYRLASGNFEGRYTGSEGQVRAGEYIRDEFKKDGLQAPQIAGEPSYIKDYALESCRWKDQRLMVDGVEFRVGEDFLFLGDPVSIKGTYPVVFAGFGIEDSAYSDYGNLDVKGKIMLVFSGEPRDKHGVSVISGRKEPSRKAYYFSKATVAVDKGAAGIIIIARKDSDFKKYLKNSEYAHQRPYISYPAGEDDTLKHKEAFSAYVDLKTAARLVNKDPESLSAALHEMESGLKTTAGSFTGSVEIDASVDCVPMITGNVIGMVEGTDKKGEAVVVIAHYDHLGEKNKKIYYGADDNASGTAAVMEMAEAFSQAASDGHRPERTIVFIGVSGEEQGLYGSRFYSENPVIPLDSTFACVNIDMIGRANPRIREGPDYISGYAYVSEDILEVSRKNSTLLAPGLADSMAFRSHVRGGSDHYYFAEHGIPSLFYFEGIHKDYHEPTDTPDKILYDRMEQIVRIIFATTWDLANSTEELKIKN